MPTHPLTGARYPTTGSSPNGPQQIQDAVADLSTQVVPRFATTAARDSAFSTWTSGGNTIAEGMTCFTQADNQLWIYNGTAWSWPEWAQGIIGRSNFTSDGVVISNADSGLPAFDVITPFIPTGRQLRVSVSGKIAIDTGTGIYTFRMYRGAYSSGTLLRTADIQVSQGGMYFYAQLIVNTASNLTNQLWTLGGQRTVGTGTFSIYGGSGAMQFLVEDLGAV